MAVAGPRKFVLDTDCFVDASRTDAAAAAFAEFCAWAAPGLYLSTVVAAELRAGAGSAKDRRTLERQILSPYMRRERLLNPSPAAWEALGTTLAALVENEGSCLARSVEASCSISSLHARAATLARRSSLAIQPICHASPRCSRSTSPLPTRFAAERRAQTRTPAGCVVRHRGDLDANPTIGQHLASSVTTGTHCCYHSADSSSKRCSQHRM
jgi:predicted nucleic acid-binding protein